MPQTRVCDQIKWDMQILIELGFTRWIEYFNIKACNWKLFQN